MKESAPKKLEVSAVSSFWNHQLSAPCAKSQRWRNIYVFVFLRSVIDQLGAGIHFFPQNLQMETYLCKQIMSRCQEVCIIWFLTTGSRGNPVQKKMGTKDTTNIGLSSAALGRRRLICFPSKWLGIVAKKSEILPNRWTKSAEILCTKRESIFTARRENNIILILTLVIVSPCIIDTIM